MYGLLTDIVVMMFVFGKLPFLTTKDAVFIHNLYGLIDAIVLCTIILLFLNLKRSRIVGVSMSLFFGLFWYLSFFSSVHMNNSARSLNAIFDTVSELAIAAASAYTLLQLTKPGHKSPLWALVILSSIFFYNFCSFFVAAFIDSDFIKDIWFLNSILNILTMLGYSLGFWLAFKWHKKHAVH